MKEFYLIILMFSLCVNMTCVQTSDSDWNDLIEALAENESGYNPSAVSRDKKYVGYLQMSTGCVDGCNKILGKKVYTYNDRLSREKSIEMFNIIQSYYNKNRDMCLAIRLWGAGEKALKNPNIGQRAYQEVMAIYRKNKKAHK